MRKSKRISFKESAHQVLDLLTALSFIKGEVEVANFVTDLLTESEVLVISKRLRIAKLLLSGDTMDSVVEETGAGKNTVAKIAHWLENRGSGFREVIDKLPKDRESKEIDGSAWKFTRRYKSYFSLFNSLESLLSGEGHTNKDIRRAKELVGKLREKRIESKEIDKSFRRG